MEKAEKYFDIAVKGNINNNNNINIYTFHIIFNK